MTARRTALVSGASIAGPVLAYWLSRYGWDVTLLERAPSPRSAGQNVDVRGVGVEVLARTGVLDDVAGRRTPEQGLAFLAPSGRVSGRFPADASEGDGATAEHEILRGDLSSILLGACEGRVQVVYGDQISGIDDTEDGAVVRLLGGTTHEVDLVAAADGMNSTTRDLMGLTADVRHLGLEITYFTIPRAPGDDDWWRWYDPSGRRSVHLRPDPYGTIRASLCRIVDKGAASELVGRSREEQVGAVRSAFADVGWEVPRVLAGLEAADDVYFEHLGQVRTGTWSAGHRVLVGDAAHCASPMSGMGTTLAVTGGYVLAGEVAAHVALRDGLASYDRVLRPLVDAAQDLPPGVPGLAYPRSRVGSEVLSRGIGVMSSRPVQKVAGLFGSRPADVIALPDYGHLVST